MEIIGRNCFLTVTSSNMNFLFYIYFCTFIFKNPFFRGQSKRSFDRVTAF